MYNALKKTVVMAKSREINVYFHLYENGDSAPQRVNEDKIKHSRSFERRIILLDH